MAETPYGGAYGLALPQFAGAGALIPAPEHWLSWTLAFSDDAVTGPWQWSANRADLPVQPSGRAVVDRAAALTTLHRVPRRDDALLHPYLGTTALAVAGWQGRLALHAGVIVREGRAWGLLGDRGAGKSSTLMWWSLHAGRVVADDLLITDGVSVLAGPRFIDLRASAAQEYGVGTDVGTLGSRRRWRVPLEPVAPETPLAGLIELRWGPDIGIDPVPVSERLDLLRAHHGFRFAVDDQLSAMRALGLPTVRFSRPKSWKHLASALNRLRAYLDSV